jgi:predicted ATPase
MFIKKIRVSNFKSFSNLNVNLSAINGLIGANAAGKSNFTQLFRFLRDILDYGLKNAISIQGGVEFLRNNKIGSSKRLSFTILFENKIRRLSLADPFGKIGQTDIYGIKSFEQQYSFSLKFLDNGRDFRIVNEKIIFYSTIAELEQAGKGKLKEKKEFPDVKIIIKRYRNAPKVLIEGLPANMKIPLGNIFAPYLPAYDFGFKFDPDELLIEYYQHLVGIPRLSIYDFGPNLSKKAVMLTGKSNLEEDGNNLAIVLKDIIEDEEKYKKFSNILKDFLPFIQEIDVEKFADKSFLYKTKEIYSQDFYIPASMISDGTIQIMVLIIVLFFEDSPFIIIEEPGRNLHPNLSSKVVNALIDASKHKQIIITTHNPDIVAKLGIDNLLLISRNKAGFSEIILPKKNKQVKLFLKNELGVDELFVQNLLGVGI